GRGATHVPPALGAALRLAAGRIAARVALPRRTQHRDQRVPVGAGAGTGGGGERGLRRGPAHTPRAPRIRRAARRPRPRHRSAPHPPPRGLRPALHPRVVLPRDRGDHGHLDPDRREPVERGPRHAPRDARTAPRRLTGARRPPRFPAPFPPPSAAMVWIAALARA